MSLANVLCGIHVPCPSALPEILTGTHMSCSQIRDPSSVLCGRFVGDGYRQIRIACWIWGVSVCMCV